MQALDFLNKGKGVITLCGSTRFYFEAIEANRILTSLNWVVLSCGVWEHSVHKYAPKIEHDISKIKKLHFIKIMMSNAIVVITDNAGYTGKSTIAEIKFANEYKVPVFYFDGYIFRGYTDKNHTASTIWEYRERCLDDYFKDNNLGI